MRKLGVFLALVFSVGGRANTAPPFHGELLNGGRVSLAQYQKKDRALFLSFWASWCGPCLQELHTVTEKLKADPSIPLDVLAVNVDTSETTSDVKPAVRLHQIAFPVVLDPKHDIFSKYQKSKTLPFSVLIAPTGEIVATFTGYHEEMFDKVKKLLAPTVSNATNR